MIARLLLANALELGTGLGVAAAVGAPLASSYLLGLAVVGIVSAHLALVHVSFGWSGLAIVAAASLAIAYLRGARPAVPRPGIRVPVIAAVGAAALVAMLARAWPTFAAKPLDNYDAWAMWGMKAKALVDFGWADPSLFASSGAAELHLDYPLLVPSLEAVAARAMGGYDERLIHLQFLLVGVAGVAALAGLLRPRVRPELLWPMLVAVAFAPAFLGQLVTAYADIPLGLFVAAGVAAAARWVDEGDVSLLVVATVCFAAAALTKNEGTLFVVCAELALLLATRRLRWVLLSAGAVECVLLPWQIWLATHHIHSDTTTFLHVVGRQPAGVGPTVLHGLLDRVLSLHAWPLLVPIFVVAVLAAAGTRLAVFAWSWFVLALLALAAVYVASPLPYSEYLSSSGERVIDAVVIACAALVPLLAQEVSEGLTTISSR
jgi:hypothetical protein